MLIMHKTFLSLQTETCLTLWGGSQVLNQSPSRVNESKVKLDPDLPLSGQCSAHL